MKRKSPGIYVDEKRLDPTPLYRELIEIDLYADGARAHVEIVQDVAAEFGRGANIETISKTATDSLVVGITSQSQTTVRAVRERIAERINAVGGKHKTSRSTSIPSPKPVSTEHSDFKIWEERSPYRSEAHVESGHMPVRHEAGGNTARIRFQARAGARTPFPCPICGTENILSVERLWKTMETKPSRVMVCPCGADYFVEAMRAEADVDSAGDAEGTLLIFGGNPNYNLDSCPFGKAIIIDAPKKPRIALPKPDSFATSDELFDSIVEKK